MFFVEGVGLFNQLIACMAFIFPPIFIVYILPSTAFTCADYHYSWCTNYIPVNITDIHLENEISYGSYVWENDIYACKIYDYTFSNESYIEGYYQKIIIINA